MLQKLGESVAHSEKSDGDWKQEEKSAFYKSKTKCVRNPYIPHTVEQERLRKAYWNAKYLKYLMLLWKKLK